MAVTPEPDRRKEQPRISSDVSSFDLASSLDLAITREECDSTYFDINAIVEQNEQTHMIDSALLGFGWGSSSITPADQLTALWTRVFQLIPAPSLSGRRRVSARARAMQQRCPERADQELGMQTMAHYFFFHSLLTSLVRA